MSMSKVLRIKSHIITLMLMGAVLLQASVLVADEIERAEDWFNNITTLEARFKQAGSDGSYAEGVFYFKRPFHSRFEYDAPVPVVLITSDVWLHIDEKDERRVTSYPIFETPLSAILKERVTLRGQSFTTEASTKGGIVSVAMDQPDGLAAGKLVLEFTEKPFELRRWLVTDANGIITSISLSNIVKGKPIANRLFVPSRYPTGRDN